MNALILHDVISPDARPDELDALVQVRVISEALQALGHAPSAMSFSWNLDETHEAIRSRRPDFVVNLVESVRSSGRWVYLAPALLDDMKLPYTGSSTDAMFLTANKLVTKQLLDAHGISTPAWLSLNQSPESKRRVGESRIDDERPKPRAGAWGSDAGDRPRQHSVTPGRYIIKSVWEEASVGLDEDSVLWADDAAVLHEAISQRLDRLGGHGFAEEYIDGREFNLSLLAANSSRESPSCENPFSHAREGIPAVMGARKDSRTSTSGPRAEDEDGPQVLPPAEIDFVDYAADKPKVVGYRAKWDADSFEYHHTPRRFDFPEEDIPLLRQLTDIAKECWQILGLRGYARVDFRVDRDGKPWVLEVNANPCLSPDAGFFAAAQRAGLTFEQIIERVIADAFQHSPRIDPCIPQRSIPL